MVTAGGAGFDANAVRTGGAVYDPVTGVTRMLYLGRPYAGGEWAAGLAYTTARTTGTFISAVTASIVSTLKLVATLANIRGLAGGGPTLQGYSLQATLYDAAGQGRRGPA